MPGYCGAAGVTRALSAARKSIVFIGETLVISLFKSTVTVHSGSTRDAEMSPMTTSLLYRVAGMAVTAAR